MPVVLVIAVLVTVLGTAGDLSISLLKREAGVKDSGHMLPGHGGALDRVDSLLWAVTLAYYVVYYLV
jgi:phosphatidate cytidylyltransferase